MEEISFGLIVNPLVLDLMKTNTFTIGFVSSQRKEDESKGRNLGDIYPGVISSDPLLFEPGKGDVGRNYL